LRRESANMTQEEKKQRAADPTASAKKAAAKVRKLASELNDALDAAFKGDLSVALSVSGIVDGVAGTAAVSSVVGVTVTSIEARVDL